VFIVEDAFGGFKRELQTMVAIFIVMDLQISFVANGIKLQMQQGEEKKPKRTESERSNK
jgi:hypothetical protein